MKCTKPSVLVVLVPTLAVALGVSRSAGSQGQASNGEVTLSVEGPRPLAEAAKRTKTGGYARGWGYTNVELVNSPQSTQGTQGTPGNYSRVYVRFKK